MEFEFNAKNLAKPWFRALIGVIFVVAGFFCVTSDDVFSSVTRESCIEGEGTIYDMRVDSSRVNTARGIWLVFNDYEQSLTIHSSCSSDELVSAMYEIKNQGTRLKFLHSEDSGTIYELWADGKQLLDFETSREKVGGNVALVRYAGYVLLPAGALFIISVPVVELIKKRKNKSDDLNN